MFYLITYLLPIALAGRYCNRSCPSVRLFVSTLEQTDLSLDFLHVNESWVSHDRSSPGIKTQRVKRGGQCYRVKVSKEEQSSSSSSASSFYLPNDTTVCTSTSGGHTGGASGAVHQGPRPLGAHQRGPDSNFFILISSVSHFASHSGYCREIVF